MIDIRHLDERIIVCIKPSGVLSTDEEGGLPQLLQEQLKLEHREHTFTNMAYDVLRVINGEEPIVPLATFEDAYQTQRILEAALISAEEKRFVKLDEVR